LLSAAKANEGISQ